MAEIAAIIPARGGSTRLPRKNIKKLCGKPMMVYAIEAVQKSKIDRCFVSTEDEEIAQIAHKAGAGVINRPQRLASGEINCEIVCDHALDAMKTQEYYPDYVTYVAANMPLVTFEDLNKVVDKMLIHRVHGVITCTKLRQPVPTHYFIMGKKRQMIPLEGYKGHYHAYSDYYFAGRSIIMIENKPPINYLDFTQDTFLTVEIPDTHAVDIDYLYDFQYAEVLMKERLKNERKP